MQTKMGSSCTKPRKTLDEMDEFEEYLEKQIDYNLNQKRKMRIIKICNYFKSFLRSKQIIDQIIDILTYTGDGDYESIYEFLYYLYSTYKLYEIKYLSYKRTKLKNTRANKILKYIYKACKNTYDLIRKKLKLNFVIILYIIIS